MHRAGCKHLAGGRRLALGVSRFFLFVGGDGGLVSLRLSGTEKK